MKLVSRDERRTRFLKFDDPSVAGWNPPRRTTRAVHRGLNGRPKTDTEDSKGHSARRQLIRHRQRTFRRGSREQISGLITIKLF